MSIDRKKLRWNGWGWNEAPDVLGENAEKIWKWVEDTMGLSPLPYTPSVAPEEVALPPIQINAAGLRELESLIGAENVCTDAYERLWHAPGPEPARSALSAQR